MIKKRLILVLLTAILPLVLMAQCEEQVVYDEEAGEDILIGGVDWSCFEGDLFVSWFMPEYEEYVPSETMISALNTVEGEFHIRIYLGTWCSDSQREVPRFKKILDESSLDVYVEIIALDRQKLLPDGSVPLDEVDFVPTFIVYKDGEELGRIIETPIETLEQDLLEIIQ